MDRKRATPHRGNDGGAKNVRVPEDATIVPDYERGALVAGLMTACAFGACLLHWAVVAC